MTARKKPMKKGFGILARTVREFTKDECPLMAAAMSYYTLFSLPPLLVLVILVAGVFVDPAEIRGTIETQMGELIGPEGADQISTIIEQADRPDTGGPVAVIVSIGVLLFSATGAFFQLQKALNRAWNVEPDPKQGGVRSFIVKRLFSVGMVLVITFLLLVSLVVSAILSAAGGYLGQLLPGAVTEFVLHGVNFLVSFGFVAVLFAAIYKILPDAEIAWKDVWFGAIASSALFSIGKSLIGYYLGRSDPGSVFGAAGSLAVILVWVYYTSMILFLGAEFTQVLVTRRTGRVEPQKGAKQARPDKIREHAGFPPFRRFIRTLRRTVTPPEPGSPL